MNTPLLEHDKHEHDSEFYSVLEVICRHRKAGGCPGCTVLVFHCERQSSKEDIYSIGWICLRFLCESKELFLSLRDNDVKNINSS